MGAKSGDIRTAHYQFILLPFHKRLRGTGFSTQEAHDMSIATMLNAHKTGVKLLRKEKGTTDFKELSIEYIKDTSGKTTDIKIKKCK